MGFPFLGMKCSKVGCGDGCATLGGPKTIEFCTFHGGVVVSAYRDKVVYKKQIESGR